MNICTLSLVCINLALLTAFSVDAAEEADSTQTATSKTDENMKVAPEFLVRWKNIHSTLKKHAYETQQTRTASGVRGAESQEDNLLEKLYGTTNRAPSPREMRQAVAQLEGLIKADPEAERVPEYKLWIAECYAQLATSAYQNLINQHPKTEQAKQAQATLKKKTISKPDITDVKK